MNLRNNSFWLVFGAALLAAMSLAPWLTPTPPQPTAAEVWSFIASHAPARGVDPRFAYAIAVAESGLNADAFTHGARGLMQMRWDAWDTVSTDPFRGAWDWRQNTTNALAYLAWCRDFLAQHHALSSGLLAACYRYGPQAVQDADFQLRNLPRPRNPTYRQLFNGDPAPAQPPTEGKPGGAEEL